MRTTHLSRPKSVGGFTLIELMIALLLISLIGLGIFSYFGRSSANFQTSELANEINSSAELLQKLLRDDVEQVAYLNPACDAHAPAGATSPCSDLHILSGITPFPDADRATMTAATNLNVPTNLVDAANTLITTNDAVRLATFDLQGSSNCPLDIRQPNNPPVASTSAAEHIYVRCGCNNLETGRIYALIETINNVTYSNVFQITNLLNNCSAATPSNYHRLTLSSAGNRFNQVGGMGRSGFTSEARIFPIKFIEWALESEALYRREIKPNSSDFLGAKPWVMVQNSVEGLQFYPMTITTTSVIEHQRSMQFSTDPLNDGLEDIRGVSARFVIKSNRPTARHDRTFDNPMTPAVESDYFPRKEIKFFIQLRNI